VGERSFKKNLCNVFKPQTNISEFQEAEVKEEQINEKKRRERRR
jgi:hypothetical protein